MSQQKELKIPAFSDLPKLKLSFFDIYKRYMVFEKDGKLVSTKGQPKEYVEIGALLKEKEKSVILVVDLKGVPRITVSMPRALVKVIENNRVCVDRYAYEKIFVGNLEAALSAKKTEWRGQYAR